jgi:hypothetical protein
VSCAGFVSKRHRTTAHSQAAQYSDLPEAQNKKGAEPVTLSSPLPRNLGFCRFRLLPLPPGGGSTYSRSVLDAR